MWNKTQNKIVSGILPLSDNEELNNRQFKIGFTEKHKNSLIMNKIQIYIISIMQGFSLIIAINLAFSKNL